MVYAVLTPARSAPPVTSYVGTSSPRQARPAPAARSVGHFRGYPKRPLGSTTKADLASERGARYEAVPGAGGEAEPSPPVIDATAPSVAHVEASVDQLASTDLDALSDGDLDALLRRLRRPIAQLVALRSRAAAASQARRVAASPGLTGAVLREHQRELATDQRLSASQAKREIEAGRAAREHEATGAAFVDGAIDPEQARMIAHVLGQFAPELRDEVEAELLELARRLDPVAFGRAARSVLAKQAPLAAAQDERRRHLARRVRACDTPDGGFAFSGLLYGAAAEQARVALDAFRKPDVPGEHRSPEQRSADAFEQLCAAALRGGAAPTTHGVRPHVIVVIDAAQLAEWRSSGSVSAARFGSSGQPVTSQEFGSLLSDCDLTRLVVDAAGTPIEASASVRTVPIGLWRSLLVRDGGCTWEACDAPASWCDVAHGETPFAEDGRLSPSNSALLCRRHHRRFDRGGHRIVIDGNSVSYVPLSTSAVQGGDDRAGPQDADPGPPDRHGRSPSDGATSTPPLDLDTRTGPWDQTTLPGSDPP